MNEDSIKVYNRCLWNHLQCAMFYHQQSWKRDATINRLRDNSEQMFWDCARAMVECEIPLVIQQVP